MGRKSAISKATEAELEAELDDARATLKAIEAAAAPASGRGRAAALRKARAAAATIEKVHVEQRQRHNDRRDARDAQVAAAVAWRQDLEVIEKRRAEKRAEGQASIDAAHQELVERARPQVEARREVPPLWSGFAPSVVAVLASSTMCCWLKGVAHPGDTYVDDRGNEYQVDATGRIPQMITPDQAMVLLAALYVIAERGGETGEVHLHPREKNLWPQGTRDTVSALQRLRELKLIRWEQTGADSMLLAYGKTTLALIDEFEQAFLGKLTAKPAARRMMTVPSAHDRAAHLELQRAVEQANARVRMARPTERIYLDAEESAPARALGQW